MNSTANVIAFPAVGGSPDDRPATFDEYLGSIGLPANTVRNYVWRLNKLAESGSVKSVK